MFYGVDFYRETTGSIVRAVSYSWPVHCKLSLKCCGGWGCPGSNKLITKNVKQKQFSQILHTL